MTTCHYCAAPATTRDHVIPRSRGGVGAFVPACAQCNVLRGSESYPTFAHRHGVDSSTIVDVMIKAFHAYRRYWANPKNKGRVVSIGGARVLKRFAPEPSKTDRGALDRYVAHHGQRGRAPETPVGVDEMGPLDPTDLTMTPGEWVEIRVSRGDKRG